jgi:hypothetical protein
VNPWIKQPLARSLVDMSELLVGGFGAILGGGISLVGTILVTRQERTRQHRAELYLDVLPPIIDELSTGRGQVSAARFHIDLVLRKATVAGRRDRHRVRPARAAVERAEAAQNEYGEAQAALSTSDDDSPRHQMARAESRQVEEIKRSGEALSGYLAWLERRLT